MTRPSNQGTNAAEVKDAASSNPTQARLGNNSGNSTQHTTASSLPTRRQAQQGDISISLPSTAVPTLAFASDVAHTGLAEQEVQAAISATIDTFAHFVIEKLAAAHGLLPIYKLYEYVSAAAGWLAVTGGEGGTELGAPIPLGHGVALELDIHLSMRKDTSGPPITLCVVPSQQDSAGALAIDGLDITPEPELADPHSVVTTARSQFEDGVATIPIRITDSLPTDVTARALTAKSLAEQRLLPHLQHNPDIRKAGIDLIIMYDPHAHIALWINLTENHAKSRRNLIRIQISDYLDINLIHPPPADGDLPYSEPSDNQIRWF